MPPVVFTQSTCAPLRETDNGLMALGGQELPAASSSLLLPLQNWESSTVASRPLTRLQLQEALLNLIQVRLLTYSQHQGRLSCLDAGLSRVPPPPPTASKLS